MKIIPSKVRQENLLPLLNLVVLHKIQIVLFLANTRNAGHFRTADTLSPGRSQETLLAGGLPPSAKPAFQPTSSPNSRNAADSAGDFGYSTGDPGNDSSDTGGTYPVFFKRRYAAQASLLTRLTLLPQSAGHFQTAYASAPAGRRGP